MKIMWANHFCLDNFLEKIILGNLLKFLGPSIQVIDRSRYQYLISKFNKYQLVRVLDYSTDR